MEGLTQEVWQLLFGSLGVGIGGGAGLVGAKWLLEFVAGRADKMNARLDEQTQKLISNLSSRVSTLEDRVDKAETELADCRSKHSIASLEVERLRAQLESYNGR